MDPGLVPVFQYSLHMFIYVIEQFISSGAVICHREGISVLGISSANIPGYGFKGGRGVKYGFINITELFCLLCDAVCQPFKAAIRVAVIHGIKANISSFVGALYRRDPVDDFKIFHDFSIFWVNIGALRRSRSCCAGLGTGWRAKKLQIIAYYVILSGGTLAPMPWRPL